VIRLVGVLALLALLVGPGHAETVVELPRTKTQLTLDGAWQRVPAKEVVAAFRHTDGAVLAITRADVPNPEAWQKDKKQAYANRVERGIAAKIPGYKRRAKKLVDANGIPALDVEARREGGATVVVRVLMFRTYALSIAIEVPRGADVKLARAIQKVFAPPREPKG
jgi:hypothetical protein